MKTLRRGNIFPGIVFAWIAEQAQIPTPPKLIKTMIMLFCVSQAGNFGKFVLAVEESNSN